MKLGISLKIDVTKIDKARLFAAQSGAKYLDMTTFVDLDNPGQYGDHGFISQNVSKEERQQGVQGAILGNAKVFYNDAQQQSGFQQPQAHPNQSGGMPPQGTAQRPNAPVPQNQIDPNDDFTDEIPF
jgi:hypothetical protein